jgi:hypothetical protein
VLGGATPPVVDLRDLEAPEPMEQVLLTCAQLTAGDFFLAHLPHVPIPLFPLLQSRGLRWWVHEEADQSALLLVQKEM